MIETVYCAGVTQRSWRDKINPIWWLGNDEEPTPPDWYKPGRSNWWRMVSWYLRNPLMNFARYVIGVCDRPHWVTGPHPAMTNLWTDDDPTHFGWKWSIIWLFGIPLLPFVSYEGRYVIVYAGWQPWGFFGFKLNLKVNILNLW